MNRWLKGIFFLLVLISTLTACGQTAEPTAAPDISPTKVEAQATESGPDGVVEPCTFKVAMIGPLTGDAAFWGNQMVQGATLAIDQINQSGGIASGPYEGCIYEIVGPFDDQGDPAESTNIAQQVATMDDVMAIIGPVNSSNGFAILPILQDARIPTISGGASNPDLTKQGWDNFFRAFLNDGGGAKFVAKLFDQQGWDRVVVAYSNNDYGRGIFESFQTTAIELGVEILSADAWAPGDREFTPTITKWQSLEPNAIFIGGEYTEAALVTKQARLAGMEQPIVLQGAYGPDFLEIAGEQAEGAIIETLFDPFRPDELTQTFVKEFKENNDEDPAENGAIGFDAALVLNDAVGRMDGKSREDLINSLSATDNFQGMNYNISFDETGEMLVPDSAPLVIVKNGEYASYGVAE